MWASVCVSTDSMPTAVSKERGGDYHAMASRQGVLSEGERERKRVGFDWWMVWK